MTDEEYIKEWVSKAEKDIKTVEIMKEVEDVTEIVCFHCQQAVEKYLKALLIANDIEFPKTHNIDFLLKQSMNINPSFEKFMGNSLSEYAVDMRYPDIRYIPTEDEMNEAIDLMYAIIEFVKGIMKRENLF